MKEKERFIPLPAKEKFLLIIRENGTYFESYFKDIVPTHEKFFVGRAFFPDRIYKNELNVKIPIKDYVINESQFMDIFGCDGFVKLIIGISNKLIIIISCFISSIEISASTHEEYATITFVSNRHPVTVLERN